MNAWYSSQNRFISKVKKDWKKRGFKPNAGNYNILRFAYRNMIFYANLRNERVSKVNRVNINPKLF